MEQLPPSPQTPPNQSTQNLNNINRWGHTRLGLLILGILGLTVFGRFCGKKEVTDKTPGQAVEIKTPPPVEIISSTKIVNKFIPPEGKIVITPIDPTKSIDDLVKIHYQEIGFTFEPGVEFSGNYYYSYGVDAKLFYAYRFGLGMGIVSGSNVDLWISPSVFASYRLDQIHLRDTEAIITYVPLGKIPLGIGVRINL